MIKLEHLRKEYPNVTPLADVNATINQGDIISVIGPSGTGKSTLIRCINMLDKPTSGHIYIDDVDVTDKSCDLTNVRKKVGMVFQSFNLFENLTVIENVMRPPMDLLGMGRQEAYDQAMDLLHMVGLDDRAMDYPSMLSGGQKQRVAIARTLSMNPEIILFDEPTSALDPSMVRDVEKVIKNLANLGKTMMIVTHEMRFAREISNRVFYMDNGGIHVDGSPEDVFDNPEDPRIRKFLHLDNKCEIRIDSKDYNFFESVNKILQFAIQAQIPHRMISRLQTAFEELCHQILLPILDDPHMVFTIEYRAHEEQAIVYLQYNGPAYDPSTTDKDICLKLFNNAVDEISYESHTEGEYTNHIRFVLFNREEIDR